MRITLLLLLVILLVPNVSAQDDGSPPYIHYYSPLHNGLIIERADGSDSRLIADVVPEDHNRVIWYGWSPTGRYFAFGSYFSTGEGAAYIQHLQAISADGQTRFTLGQYRIYDFFSLWANQTDRLLIAGLIRSTDQLADSRHAQIVDIATQTKRNQLQMAYWLRDLPSSFGNTGKLYWSSDDTHAYVQWPEYLLTLGWDGSTQLLNFLRPFDSGSWAFDFHLGRLMREDRANDSHYSIIIQDVDTDQWLEIEDSLGWPSTPYTIRWSPTLDYALIYARNCPEDDCEYSLRLVDWTSGDVTILDPTIPIPRDDYECHEHACKNLWSPNGQYAALSGEAGELYIVDAASGTTRQIAADTFYYEWTYADTLAITYVPDGNLYLYDPISDQESELELALDYSGYGLSPSPYRSVIGLWSDPPSVIDYQGNVVTQTLPHSHSTNTVRSPTYGYNWHPDGKWAMANHNIFFAGGGLGPSASVVFDLEGTTRRELPTRGNAGFVPERAIPYLAPGQPVSAKKDPIYALAQEGRVEGVGWHPSDPNRLVTYSQDAGLIFWLLDAGEARITDRIMPLIHYPTQFPTGTRLFWLPEDEVVAVYDSLTYRDAGFLRRPDDETGEFIEAEGIESPQLVIEGGGASIQIGSSGKGVQLEATDAVFDFPRFIASDLSGLIVSGDEVDRGIYYIDASTGTVTGLDVPEHFYFSADARDGIAALGSGNNCCVKVLSTETGELLDEFYGTAYSLALSADGRRLATTSNGMTAIWDMSAYLDE